VVDINEFLCSKEFCSPLGSDNRELLFTDADHLSLEVNNIILNKVLNSIYESEIGK